MVEMAPAMQHQALQAGSIDIGVHPWLATGASSDTPLRAFSDRAPLCGAAEEPSAGKEAQNLNARTGWANVLFSTIVTIRPPVFDKVITLCTEAGFSPRIGATATVSSGVLALVEAGEGLAILPGASQRLSTEELSLFRSPIAPRSSTWSSPGPHSMKVPCFALFSTSPAR